MLRPAARCRRSRPSAYAVPAPTTTTSAPGLANTAPAASRASGTRNEQHVAALEQDQGEIDGTDEQPELGEEQQLAGVIARRGVAAGGDHVQPARQEQRPDRDR